MAKKRKTGTREWADTNYNIGIGCSHNCRYCYARANALRYEFIDNSDSWTTERVKDRLPPISTKGGWTMFPTTHDITPYYLPTTIEVLKKMLEKGNKVLIVTKPHIECVAEICAALDEYPKENILFRFTIGSCVDATLKFWEPGAPLFKERMDSLKYAWEHGFATSVSMEPMLGTVRETVDVFNMLTPFVTDKIWVGKMNKINNRVKMIDTLTAQECNRIVALQSDENILWLVKELKDNSKIEWKDSIKLVIEKYGTVNT